MVGLLVVNLVLAIPLLFWSLMGKANSKMGSNSATRFARKAYDGVAQNGRVFICILVSVIFILIGCIACGVSGIVCGLPTLGVAVLNVCYRAGSVNDKERIRDARVVTKQALASGEAIGTVAGTVAEVHGVKGASHVGKALGQYAEQVGANMEVEGVTQTVRFDTNQFLQYAQRYGVETDGRSDEEVAQQVLQIAPQSLIAELPNDMSDVEKASTILTSTYEEVVPA